MVVEVMVGGGGGLLRFLRWGRNQGGTYSFVRVAAHNYFYKFIINHHKSMKERRARRRLTMEMNIFNLSTFFLYASPLSPIL